MEEQPKAPRQPGWKRIEHQDQEDRGRAVKIAHLIAKKLSEPRRRVETLVRFVRLVGPKAALGLADDALAAAATGEMMTQDGSRARTPGGCFFALAGQRGLLAKPSWAKRYVRRGYLPRPTVETNAEPTSARLDSPPPETPDSAKP